MDIHIHHWHHLPGETSTSMISPDKMDQVLTLLQEMRKDTMGLKDDLIAAIQVSTGTLKQHITDTGARATSDFAVLNAAIATLQAQIAAGSVTLADLQPVIDANTQLSASIDQIDPTTPAPVVPVTSTNP